ncbi:MAG: UDP-N-acetyl glucosamine 2-epimerase, partial [Bacteroidia bacterium]
MKRILTVVGTRPNFIKITQFRKVAAQFPQLDLKIVHTGQHYDGKMADVFFQQFGLHPDFLLDVPPGSPNAQMAEIMLRLEKLIEFHKPDLVVVVGDVNSTLAAALTANKLNIKLAHIESGLRSNDRTMPEEFNRIITDELADFLFVTEPSGLENLRKEGKTADKLFFVGNTMIDTLAAFANEIDASPILKTWNLEPRNFVLMTMHRPATVDSKDGLLKLLELIREVCKTTDLIFPIHPRTVKQIQQFGLEQDFLRIGRL